MAAPRRRPEQVGELVRQVIAEALLREVRDPRIKLVTVTRVTVTGDLSLARVYVTASGDDADRDAALAGLESASGFLRSRVAKALNGRTTPELVFEPDRGTEHAQRIDQILGELRRADEGRAP